ncbi:site-specific integrase [Mesorhizobium sp. M1E.F.Ca.ET.045.02.1.1]|uniref:tyrosine-type recombinase/integrase n=1 Tax=Mesorhizobium sp. M1E.F.Ca.ET.045.02.1.1 TaxID=2493672 RepID=UPI002479FDCC|nr:site-specific integrase [Mesorhizobium sp. M1E.F.Ca.ET.045.02.1.1]
MVRSLNLLAETSIRAKEMKPGRYSDGGGLYLMVKKGGTKSWTFVHFKGSGAGRAWKEAGLGSYPGVSLKEARLAAAGCRDRLRRGLEPIDADAEVEAPTFAKCADDFIAEAGKGWSNPKHKAQWEMTLGDAYCKSIRAKAVSEVTTADVLAILKPVWQAKPETAQRLRGRVERVLDFAKASGHRSGENPALWRGHLQHLLAKGKKLSRGHHSAMPYSDVPAFVKRLRTSGAMSAKALEFLILTAARSGEVLGAVWDELDLEEKVWTVPAARMKARKVHRVPLTDAAINILIPLHEARVSAYVFPGETKKGGSEAPLSVMAMTMQMRRMEVGEFTPHGFRSAFRDWCGDQTSFPREVAEAALAHKVGDSVENAYRRSDALEKRRKLMNAWSNFLNAPARGNLRLVGGNAR